jgi:dolichol-phosphate mannosyltransferase
MYGCPEAIPELHRRLTETLTKLAGDDYEIIMVNDHCPKNSWEGIRDVCSRDQHVVGIDMSRNFGQIKAILAGLDYSSGDWTVVMDCDLQDDPEEIVHLYEKAKEGYDVVFARRAERQDSKFKVFLSGLFYKFYSWATDVDYDPALCNFSICSRKVVDSYCRMRELHRAYVMYIQWMGFRQTSVDVQHHERFAGKSGYSLKKRVNVAMEILTSQSDKLLRVMLRLGFMVAFLAFIAVIVIIIRHFTTSAPAGWASLIAVTFLMGGLVLSGIGVVGIYVGNIFMEVKRRPVYLVRTILNGEQLKTEQKNESKETCNYRRLLSAGTADRKSKGNGN